MPSINDDFADAIEVEIATNGGTYTSASLDTAGNTTETNEVDEGASSNVSAWWKYTPASSGTADFDTQLSTPTSSSTDTYMAIWTGTNFADMVHVISDDDAGGSGTSLVNDLSVTGGTTYWIQVGGFGFATMNLVLRVTGPASSGGAITGAASAALSVTATAAGEITGPPVKFISQGAAVAGTTSITTAAYGTGWAEGDLGVCVVASNHATTESTEPTVSGFTNIGTLNGGGGTQGAGQGNRRLTFFTRELQAGDDTTPAIDLSTGNVMIAAITILRKPPSYDWAAAVAAFGAETTAGTSWSQAMTTDPGFSANDMLIAACAVRDTSDSSAEGFTATGATFDSLVERIDLSSETGNDIALHVATATVTAGPSSAAGTRTATHSTSETGVMGVLRVRAAVSGVTGAAAATLSLTATASGIPTTFGVAAAPLALTATAAGTPRKLGAAAAALSVTATASGVIGSEPVTGAASSSLTVTAAAAGVDRALGQAASTISLTATAQGVDRVLGQASSALSITAAAAGVPDVQGTASATLVVTANAAGTIADEPVTGVASAALTVTSTANGVDRAIGTATATLAVAATATGIDRSLGVAVATLTVTATAVGAGDTPPVTGVAVATLVVTAATVGRRTVLGVSSATLTMVSTADGVNLSIVTPAARTVVVPAEDRTVVVPAENRTVVVPARTSQEA